MKQILKSFQSYLAEIQDRWEFEILVRLEQDANLYADIFEKIRAIPGVTIVKTEEKQRRISPTQKAAVLSIKCLVGNTGLKNYGLFLRNKISKLKDEAGDRILGVRFTKFPEQI